MTTLFDADPDFGTDPRPAPNRPHYHVWRLAAGDKMIYRLARAFHTRQAAQQFGRRRWPERERWLVRACTGERCKPRMDI